MFIFKNLTHRNCLKIHKKVSLIALSLLFISGSNAFAVNPCEQTNQLSGGTIIADTTISGTKENGYRYGLWNENGGELTIYPQDACFKLSWDNPQKDVLADVGISLDDVDGVSENVDYIVNYAFQKEGDDGGTYASVDVLLGLYNGQSELCIVEDKIVDEPYRVSPSFIEKGEYVVDGDTYKVWMQKPIECIQGCYFNIISARQSYRQCGSVNVSEHLRKCKTLGLINDPNVLSHILLAVEAGGGKGSVDFTYANIEVVESTDTLPDITFSPFDSLEIKPDDKVVTQTSQGRIGNGYSYSLYSDPNTSEGMIIPGGEDDCAFKAGWLKTNDFLAEIGYLDEYATREFSDLGEITADYEYTKTSNGITLSYIGVHGFMQYPSVEFYIVDDKFDSNFYYPNCQEVGSYEMDGSIYTLYKGYRIMGDLGQVDEIDMIYAVRSSFRTSGHISVSEHFRKWEESDMNITLGRVYSCMISCEVMGGTGSIDYSKATMSWEGLEKNMESPTLVKDFISSDDIILAPNVAENFFTVKSPEEISSIEILDVFGRSLNSQTVGATVTFKLPAGTYMVKIVTVSGNTSIQKLMVK